MPTSPLLLSIREEFYTSSINSLFDRRSDTRQTKSLTSLISSPSFLVSTSRSLRLVPLNQTKNTPTQLSNNTICEISNNDSHIFLQFKPKQNAYISIGEMNRKCKYRLNMNDIIKIGNTLLKVKEISFDFIDVTLCLVQLLKEKEKIISEFSAINEECANLRKEIIEIKKSSSSQTYNIMKEKDSMMTSFEKNKISEIAKIESELRNKIERLELILKEKEEEIEKLNNDNNLLYSQYLLSEKNFEEYKNNRKSYDAELQRKYEEIQRKFIDTESEKNQIQKEIDIMNVKMKNIEASYNSKSKENEALKIKVNELVKNSII